MVEILEIFAEAQERYYPYSFLKELPTQVRPQDQKLGYNSYHSVENLKLGWKRSSLENRKSALAAKSKRYYERNREAILARRKAKRASKRPLRVLRTELPASWEQLRLGE